MYDFAVIVRKHGHHVLRLAPYISECNSIEKIWGLVLENTTFKLQDGKMLARKKFEKITPEI